MQAQYSTTEKIAEFHYGSEEGGIILALLKIIEGAAVAKAVSSFMDNFGHGVV